MQIINVDQGTLEWHSLRRCKVTGSKLDDVMGTPWARAVLISELIAEEATEQSKITRPTEEMERGTSEEEFAIKLYETKAGKKLVRGGMWKSNEFDFLLHSPDAYEVAEDGKIYEAHEVKNPDSKKAIMYKMMNMLDPKSIGITPAKAPFLGIPPEYKWQCINYFLTNPYLKKLHFHIHDARFIEEDAKLYTITLDRDNEVLQEAVEQARQALIAFRADWLTWKEVILPTSF